MTTPQVRYFILQPDSTRPVEPSKGEVEHKWPPDSRDFTYGSAEVAPGIRVKILGKGASTHHWYGGRAVEGTLIAVRDTTGTRDGV